MNRSIVSAAILLALVCGVLSHSYVTDPISRSNQKQSNTGCRGNSPTSGCLGPCDISLSKTKRAPLVAARGDSVTVKWPRNNHPAGFIRFAWAPTADSDSHDAFDSNVQQINCHEVGGCYPDDPSKPNGGDSGAGDGSVRACSSTFKIPPHLTNGNWTLQWAWFGGGFALGDYYSCIDYTISGGASGSWTPTFIGGDYSNPGKPMCKYFNTDRLHSCKYEPCDTPDYAGGKERNGAPAYVQKGSSFTPAPPTSTPPTSTPPTSTPPTSTPPTSTPPTSTPPTSTPPTSTPPTSTPPTSTPPTSTPPTTPTTPPSEPEPAVEPEPQSAPVPASCVENQNRCVGQYQYQTCTDGEFGPLTVCDDDTVCKSSTDKKIAFCVKRTETIDNNGKIVNSDSVVGSDASTLVRSSLVVVFALLAML